MDKYGRKTTWFQVRRARWFIPLVVALTVLLLATSVYAITTSWTALRPHGTGTITVPGTGVHAVLGTELYSDANCTQAVAEINFSCTATDSTGAFSVARTVYVKNTSTSGTGNYSAETAIVTALPVTLTDVAGVLITSPQYGLVVTSTYGVPAIVGTETPGTNSTPGSLIPGNAVAVTITLTGTVTANTSPTTPMGVALPDFYVNIQPN